MPYLETKLGKINYKIKRKKNSPFIVFIGGLGSNISSREDQMKYFSKYFSVLIFDNLGSGKSNKPDTDYSMEMFASNCNEIMELLKIPSAHIIGNSMGGMIAQVFASKFPKKVNKLILACTCSTRDKISKEIISISKKIVNNVGLKEIWFNALLLGYSRDYVERNFMNYKKAKVSNNQNEIEGYLNQCKAIESLNNTNYLKKIKAKTLIIFGKNDLIVPPKKSMSMAKYIKSSEVIGFPGGHGFWKEYQDIVNKEVIDFLAD